MIDWNLEGIYPREYDSLPNNLDIPDNYKCDITHTLMVDPVLCGDGHIYECLAIKKWLLKSCTSPKTRERLTNTAVVRCDKLRSKIREFVEKHCNTAVVNDPAPATMMAINQATSTTAACNTAVVNDPAPATTMAINQATSTTAASANPAFQAPARTTAQAEATMIAESTNTANNTLRDVPYLFQENYNGRTLQEKITHQVIYF